ncbi:DExH-box ATP-dependent RNA helicase DExH8 [Impatiens glandulifera]|uniref:DExH-box ATP-dependent RNA helicase DExH8 n=1 Tax=Impatiens glandulifera TaxID=253017 RepID=UPI001FB18292|nr:DExH-box ATP-dependent RNA helicase DExH8 [Impatiens glandulifera]
MASSPTASSNSSTYSSPFLSSSSSNFDHLPITASRDRIVRKIIDNRVTLIYGETGCGKSSQIPQFLLDEGIEPVLCTQPRRFAVVAVARMVAKARDCEVGGEVGYHIGHSKVCSESSKIVFKTAGVLLDEMRDKGSKALNYKVIILDEVHERSVESDLVLVCIKQFLLKNKDLRVVLMSATADFKRYIDYFKDLGRGERVEVLAISSLGQHTIYHRKVSYLEQIAQVLGRSSESLPRLSLDDAKMKPDTHNLIHDLVLHIHKNERDFTKSILVFLPSYHCLEQQWVLLKPFASSFRVHILHSSININQALMAMKISKSHRKVILATNIAESSVTIPEVAFVIDSCRSLQVFWDTNKKADSSKLVWISRSQAEQRKGRTGRTCDGQIYRLITTSFFNKLQEHECPAILKLSLRQHVLLICCAESKAINDPHFLLQKALDPPHPDVVKDALNLLVHISALEKMSSRGQYKPTFYGRLVASFSLSFDASVLILMFGNIGMLREGILLGSLMDMQAPPILCPFGQENLFASYLDSYYSGENKNPALGSRKEVGLMANLCAFQFWERSFKDKLRLQQLKQFLKFDGIKAEKALVPRSDEVEWCSFHNLAQPSLHQVAEIYEDVLHTIHKYRPKFISSAHRSSHYYPCESPHVCSLTSRKTGDENTSTWDEENNESQHCVSVPFVPSNHFRTFEVAGNLAVVVKEMRSQRAYDISCNGNNHGNYQISEVPGQASLCRYFAKGGCSRGDVCPFSHSFNAQRPTCMFFLSLQGCREGEGCFFAHQLSLPAPSSHNSTVTTVSCLPEEGTTYPQLLLRFFPLSKGCILILDDKDFRFSTCLSRFYDTSKMVITTSLSNNSTPEPSLSSARILWDLSHPEETIISKDNIIPWNEVKCILWFPNFENCREDKEGRKIIVQTVFQYLGALMLRDDSFEMLLILTMNNIRFSHLQVEKIGRDCFFTLKESFPFDESSFGKLADERSSKRSLMPSVPITYVFQLQLPTLTQP